MAPPCRGESEVRSGPGRQGPVGSGFLAHGDGVESGVSARKSGGRALGRCGLVGDKSGVGASAYVNSRRSRSDSSDPKTRGSYGRREGWRVQQLERGRCRKSHVRGRRKVTGGWANYARQPARIARRAWFTTSRQVLARHYHRRRESGKEKRRRCPAFAPKRRGRGSRAPRR